MGKLYLARDMELGSLWAVKEILPEQKKEAKLLRMIDHPAIPKMIDYVEKEDACYLVMEYIKGQSLEEKQKEGKNFSIKEIVTIGLFLADVLDYLHTRKPPVCYGDLKPANVMISETGKLYLVDLGSAVPNYSDRVQECSGTKGYAAPEQYKGKINVCSDVYAWGKTVWALCGKKGWWYALLYPRFGHMIWKCCRKNQKDRYASMEIVKRVLEKIEKNKKNIRMSYVCSFMIGVMAISWIFLSVQQKKLPLEEALSEITDLYYQENFIEGSIETRKGICKKAEKRLQHLLEVYKGEESQRKLLFLLALNGLIQGNKDLTVFYFEQLRIYYPGFADLYGEYGSYLLEIEEFEKNQELWEEYKNQEKNGTLRGTETENIKKWISDMTKERKKEDVQKKKE